MHNEIFTGLCFKNALDNEKKWCYYSRVQSKGVMLQDTLALFYFSGSLTMWTFTFFFNSILTGAGLAMDAFSAVLLWKCLSLQRQLGEM